MNSDEAIFFFENDKEYTTRPPNKRDHATACAIAALRELPALKAKIEELEEQVAFLQRIQLEGR